METETSTIKAAAFPILAIALCLPAITGCERGDVAPGPTPNIVFVLVDTLRADRVGAYGSQARHTPTVDAIAAEGVVFERAIAQSPWTQPSMASLLCSRYPTAHKVLRFVPLKSDGTRVSSKIAVLSSALHTQAELLHERGYATAGFVANPLMLADYGFAQGFDHYDTSFANNRTPGNVVNDAALAWLESRDLSKPFFLYLHYMDVHGPYEAGPEFLDELLDEVDRRPEKHRLSQQDLDRLTYLRKLPRVRTNEARHARLALYREYWVARYDAGVREFDHHLANLRSGLQAAGVWEDAYVIITSDHGESLCEHGYWKHGWTMFDTELHVPMILRWPGAIPLGRRVAETVRLIDLLPTVLDQLRLPVPNGAQGRSLTGLISGAGQPTSIAALAEAVKMGPERKALYLDDWKLIVNTQTSARRLFRLADDPNELNDLSSQFPDVTGRLLRELTTQLAASSKLAEAVDSTLTPASREQIERLKALGYIGDD